MVYLFYCLTFHVLYYMIEKFSLIFCLRADFMEVSYLLDDKDLEKLFR